METRGKLPHHTRRYALIRQIVLAALGAHPRRLGQRRMARFLRELADELERPRPSPGGPLGPRGEGLRWNGRDLLIGRALWDAIGQPRHVSFEFAGELTRIIPDDAGEYRVRRSGHGVPRIGCIRAARFGEWAEGWRPGDVQGRAIVFRADATRP